MCWQASLQNFATPPALRYANLGHARSRSSQRTPTASGEDQTVTTLDAAYQSPISKPSSSQRQKKGGRQGGSARALTSPLTAVRSFSFGIRCTPRSLSTEKPATQSAGYAR